MKRATLSKIVVFAVAVTALSFPNDGASARDISGTKCSKINQRRVVSRVTYNCRRVGGRLVWQRVGSPTTPPTLAPAPTTPPVPGAAAVVAAKINSDVDRMRTLNQPVPEVVINFSPSVLEVDRELSRRFVNGFFRYGPFGVLRGYRLGIGIGADQAETVAMAKECCNFDWPYGEIAGAYGGTGEYAMVLSNIMVHQCGIRAPDWCTNAQRTRRTQVRPGFGSNLAHEISHAGKVALMGFDPTRSNAHLYSLPAWYATGISNVFGWMIAAIVTESPFSNPSTNAKDVALCAAYPIELVSGMMADTCRGIGGGDLAAEILVARFGLDRALEFTSASRDVPDRRTWTHWAEPWAPIFQRLFLQTPESFSRDVEMYRTAVMKGTALPPDFLEAKPRP